MHNGHATTRAQKRPKSTPKIVSWGLTKLHCENRFGRPTKHPLRHLHTKHTTHASNDVIHNLSFSSAILSSIIQCSSDPIPSHNGRLSFLKHHHLENPLLHALLHRSPGPTALHAASLQFDIRANFLNLSRLHHHFIHLPPLLFPPHFTFRLTILFLLQLHFFRLLQMLTKARVYHLQHLLTPLTHHTTAYHILLLHLPPRFRLVTTMPLIPPPRKTKSPRRLDSNPICWKRSLQHPPNKLHPTRRNLYRPPQPNPIPLSPPPRRNQILSNPLLLTLLILRSLNHNSHARKSLNNSLQDPKQPARMSQTHQMAMYRQPSNVCRPCQMSRVRHFRRLKQHALKFPVRVLRKCRHRAPLLHYLR